MAIQPAQPQSIGGVLDTTFQLYKASIGKVWPLCLLAAIGGSLPTIYMVTKGLGNPNDPLALLAATQNFGYWVTYAITVAISLWTMGAMYLKSHSIGVGAEIGTGEALQGSLGRLPILFAMAILFGIAVTVGLVLLIVPGLIVMVSLMLCFNLVLFEGKGPLTALTGSHNLVWGNWWRTAAILTVGFIIIFVIYFAVGMVIGIAIPLIGIGSSDPLLTVMVSAVLIGILVSVIVTPFLVSVLIAVYWDLKLRREGGDLAARVGALGTA